MVSAIIASTLYHRIAGIMALTVFIALMKSHFINTTEGFELPISNPVSNSNARTSSASAASAASSDTWNTPDEFKQKFCTKGIVDGVNSLVDVLSPNSKLGKLDSSGKMTDVGESYSRIDFASVNGCGIYKNPINGNDQSGGIAKLCDPKCNWKMKMSTEQKKEGFTPMVANSSVQNLKNYVKDSANNVKDSANIVKDKLKESFSRFSFSS
jgi:hypothetical protein